MEVESFWAITLFTETRDRSPKPKSKISVFLVFILIFFIRFEMISATKVIQTAGGQYDPPHNTYMILITHLVGDLA